MTNDITEEELRTAITEAIVQPVTGFNEGETTAPQEAKKHKVPLLKMQTILNDLCDRGIMERAKVLFTDDWGDSRRLKGYRIKGE